MYKNPFLDGEVYTGSNNSSYWANEKKVAQYVDYLYYLNPNSIFNLYINDYWPNLFFDYIRTSDPLDQMKFVFITDGTATFNDFKSPYSIGDVDTSLSTYEKLSATWNKAKEAMVMEKEITRN